MTEFENSNKLRLRAITKVPQQLEAIGRIERLDVEGTQEILSQLDWIEAAVSERRRASLKKREDAKLG